MTNSELADRIIRQGKALVRAIEALEIIDHTGPFDRIIVGLLKAAYRHRLGAILSKVRP